MTLSSFNACVPETFSPPTLFGAEILSINAHPVLDFPASLSLEARITQPNVDKASGLAFCNVTVTYTHPGTNNLITVETWLPDKPFWNERYIAAGGGGFSAGRTEYTYSVMSAAAQEGYTTSTTDAGVGTSTWSADDWALLSPGNVDLQKVRDFGTVSLNDQVGTCSLICDICFFL